MIVIGIAGGIASGKSFVADQFAELGALVLNADRTGHEVLLEAEIKDRIRETFGDEVFADDKSEVDRGKLAEIVFHPEHGLAQLKKLEQITHPRIRELLRQQIDELQTSMAPDSCESNTNRKIRAVVLDAPVMFKSGWKEFCDVIVFVDTPFELRRQRSIDRGWKPGELEKREAMQTSLEEKRSQSDFVVSNDQSPELTRQEVQRVWDKILNNH